MTPEELAKLYDKVDAEKKVSGVKGEKATAVREEIKKLVAAMTAKGETRLSSASIKGVVCEALSANGTPFKIDASQFGNIITSMYETEKDTKTGAVIVLTDQVKAPKVRQPKKKKGEAVPDGQ